MHLIIGGVNVSKYVQDKGITRGEIYRAVKSRVTLGGKRYLTRIKKLTYTIKFDPMEESDLKQLAEVINSDYVSVSYKDPVLGTIYRQFIPTPNSVDLILEDKNEVSYWSGLELNLEEQ